MAVISTQHPVTAEIKATGLGRAVDKLDQVLETGEGMVLNMGRPGNFPGIDTGLNVVAPIRPPVGIATATDIGGSHAREVLRIVGEDGRVGLYVLSNLYYTPDHKNQMPDFDPSKKAFPQLCEWLMQHRVEGINRIANRRHLDPGDLIKNMTANSFVLSESATVAPAPYGLRGNDLRVSNIDTHWVKPYVWNVKTPHPESGVKPLANGDSFGTALVDAARNNGMNLQEIGGGNDCALVGRAVTPRQAPQGVVVAQVTSSGTNTAATKMLGEEKRFFNLECGGGFPMSESWLSDAEIQYNQKLKSLPHPECVTIETCTAFPFMTKLLEVNTAYIGERGKVPSLRGIGQLIHDDAVRAPKYFSTYDLADMVEGKFDKVLERHPDDRKVLEKAQGDLVAIATSIVTRGAKLAATVSAFSAAHRRHEEGIELVCAIDSSCANSMPLFREVHEQQYGSFCSGFGKPGRIVWMKSKGSKDSITVPIQGAFSMIGTGQVL